MANPYTSVAIVGYNASPPEDDGTQQTSNQLFWSKHKDKLGDPLNTAIVAINSNLLTAFGKIFGASILAKSANYTVTTSDQGRFIDVTAAATITLLAAATAGDGFALAIINTSGGLVTIDADGSETINGVTSIHIGPNESALLTCDGSSWAAAISRTFPSLIQSKSGNYTVLVSDTHNWLEVTADATISLLAAASAGDGFLIGIYNNGAESVTIDANSSETINGATTVILPNGAMAWLRCDGSAWTGHVSAEKGTFTGTLTGCTTAPTVTFHFMRTGHMVTIRAGAAINATSNTNAMSITGLPAGIQVGDGTINVPCVGIRDNGTDALFGSASFGASNAMTFQLSTVTGSNINQGVFTTSGSKGLANQFSVTYPRMAA